MPRTTCTTCGGDHIWSWEEAFDKFGFGDGDGMVMTDAVIRTIKTAGYDASAEAWGFHNVVITSIKRDDCDVIPPTAVIGYDSPRNYLPVSLIDFLDQHLGDDVEVEP